MKNLYFIIFFIFGFLTIVSSQGCPLVKFGNYVYDFNRLSASNGSYFINKGPYDFYVNVCNTSNVCVSQVNIFCNSCIKDLSYFKWDSNGQNNTVQIVPLASGQLGGTILTYNPSSRCIGTSQLRTTQVDLICSNSSTRIISVLESPKCYYTFVISSYLACPLNPPTPTPTSTITPKPTNSSVSTSTTSLSQDDTTITTTITTRRSYNSYSVTNTTTITNSFQTTTSTVTTFYNNGYQTRDVTTRTSVQGSQVLTKTYDTDENNQ